MTWLLLPSADRAAARRVVQRLDEVLGYPRALVEGEVVRIGPVSQTVPLALRTETLCSVYVHSTSAGATILRGAIAIHVSDAAREALRERVIEIDGVRLRLAALIVARGWEVRADRPGLDANWTDVTPRDGAPGSATGRPIPPEDDPEPDAARVAAR